MKEHQRNSGSGKKCIDNSELSFGFLKRSHKLENIKLFDLRTTSQLVVALKFKVFKDIFKQIEKEHTAQWANNVEADFAPCYIQFFHPSYRAVLLP